jgi:hypothetical protein
MTKKEWLSCRVPMEMLAFVRRRATGRKLRLFAVGCCRVIWDLLDEPTGRHLVEVSERLADGTSTKVEWAAAVIKAKQAREALNARQPKAYKRSRDAGEAGSCLITALDAAIATASPSGHDAAHSSSVAAAHASGTHAARMTSGPSYADLESYVVAEDVGRVVEYRRQADLVRDLFGPPPFRSVTLSPLLLTITVVRLAQAIYDERAFDRLAVLADALEEAGCDNAGVLAHCRAATPHVRGCWVVDLVLGKS